MTNVIDLHLNSNAAERCIPTEISNELKKRGQKFFRVIAQRFSQGRYRISKKNLALMLVERFPNLKGVIETKLHISNKNSCFTVTLKECDDVIDFM